MAGELPTIEAPPPSVPARTPATSAASSQPDQEPPGLPQLAAGWTRIEPGGETICARGTPYSFWVHPGTVNRLLIFFQGGGGCWNAETCRAGSDFFDDRVSAGDDPSGQVGILDLDNPENPFQDSYALFVPYCTGDVHWGNNVMTYEEEDGTQVAIHHKGFVNGMAAMEWVYEHFSGPESIFVTGCSAGSIGSILFAPYAIEHYSQAAVVQLGDSEAFVFDRLVDLQSEWRAHDNFPAWIPALAEIRPGEFSMARFYAAIASYYPAHRFSQYNTAHDSIQQRYFLEAGATQGSWEEALAASLAEIHVQAPNFHSWVAGGGGHCILPFAEFYTHEMEGLRFRDWVARLASGQAVENVRCADCGE